MNLPLINKVENPGFRYRQTQCYAIHADSIYKWWNRLEEPNEVFAAGYWVHTFDKLLRLLLNVLILFSKQIQINISCL